MAHRAGQLLQHGFALARLQQRQGIVTLACGQGGEYGGKLRIFTIRPQVAQYLGMVKLQCANNSLLQALLWMGGGVNRAQAGLQKVSHGLTP